MGNGSGGERLLSLGNLWGNLLDQTTCKSASNNSIIFEVRTSNGNIEIAATLDTIDHT